MQSEQENINIKELIKKYNVTPDNREKIYQKILNELKQKIVDKKQNSKNPMYIFATGQPGSGKTKLAQKIELDFRDREFVIIDLDTYRCLHPDLKEIKKYKDNSVLLTNSFSIALERDLISYAIEKKKDIIQVGTMRVTEFIENYVLDKAKEQDYVIGLYALAVPFLESALSTQVRYEEQIKNNNPIPRNTPINFQHEAQEGCLKSINMLENNELTSFVKVCKRGKILYQEEKYEELPITIYDSNIDKKIKYKNAIDAIYSNKVLNEKQLKKILGEIDKLFKIKKNRGAPEKEYIDLRKIYLEYKSIENRIVNEKQYENSV